MFFSKTEVFRAYSIIFVLLTMSIIYHSFIYEELTDTYEPHEPEKEKKYIDYVNTAHAGLFRGLIFGIILGDSGVYTGIKNAAVYGMVNPIFLYFGY